MKGIKYIGPISDFSGYANAARNYILSLHERGVPITVQPRNFDINPPKVMTDEQKQIFDFLTGRPITYDIVITHLTPDLHPLYRESGKYNISFFAWETSLLHPKWCAALEESDEIWVPCDWNVEAVRNSGIGAPAYKIPHGIDVNTFNGLEDKQFSIKDVGPTTFKFYSIFQWIYRKNPEGLVRAYFNAFDAEDDVVLILKTYLSGKPSDKEFVRNQIIEIKKDMNIGNYPRIVLIGDVLSETQLLGLHIYGDCCVSLHRGEGWGLVPFVAGLRGNPVIATGYSGNTEFMNEDNSYLVDNQLTYVSNMKQFNSWYLGNQMWAEPSTVSATDNLRRVYYNREEAKEKGLLLKKDIKEKFSWTSVTDVILDRLSKI